jgi:hypothetical protein
MRKIFLFTALLTAVFQSSNAQSPTDGLMMPKRQWCTLVQYTHSSWDEYWEGATQRSNSNLGTFTAQNTLLMTNFGVTDRFNILAALPYVWTKADASYLQGQKGLQDLSLWLKYQAFETALAGGQFKIQVTGGASIPASNYVADFLPFSIGFQSKTASLRGILNFTHGSGFYATAQAGHTWRSNVSIDRDAYLYKDRLYYTDKAPIPNVLDAGGRIGFINKKIQAEATFEHFTCLSGDDIRYNEGPVLTNKMRAAAAGLFVKYFFAPFAVQVSAGNVLNGRNVGRSTMFSGGFTYQFGLGNPKETKTGN